MASGEGTWAVTRWTFSEWASCQVFLQFHYCAIHQQERSQKPYLSTKTRNSTTSNPTKNCHPELGPHRSKNVFVLLQEIRSHDGSCKKVSKSQIHAKGEVTVPYISSTIKFSFYARNSVPCGYGKTVVWQSAGIRDLFAHEGIDANTPTNYPNAANPKMTEETKRCQS